MATLWCPGSQALSCCGLKLRAGHGRRQLGREAVPTLTETRGRLLGAPEGQCLGTAVAVRTGGNRAPAGRGRGRRDHKGKGLPRKHGRQPKWQRRSPGAQGWGRACWSPLGPPSDGTMRGTARMRPSVSCNYTSQLASQTNRPHSEFRSTGTRTGGRQRRAAQWPQFLACSLRTAPR